MSNPKISVLFPVYNAGRYVCEALGSVLTQTFSDFEVIIVEDGATDHSGAMLQEYAEQDSRIRLIKNESNEGIIFSLNRGLDLARGEYIARMDADDISLPERFALQVAYLDQHAKVGALGTNIVYIDHDGNLLNGGKPKDLTPLSPMVINWMLLWRCPVYHPTMMIRKSILDKTGFRYDAQYHHAEDRELWSRLSKQTKIVSLPDVLLRYRILPTSVSRVYEDERKATDRMITRRELMSLGIQFSETALDTLIGAFSSSDADHDFKGASELLLNAYRAFGAHSPSMIDQISIQRDVAWRMTTVADAGAKHSLKMGFAMLLKLRHIPFKRLISAMFIKRVARVLFSALWSYRVTRSNSS